MKHGLQAPGRRAAVVQVARVTLATMVAPLARVLCLLAIAPSLALAAPPQVNLLVELRLEPVADVAPSSSSAAPGDVVIGTRGSTPAAAGSTRLQTSPDAALEPQQMLLANGASATLQLRRLQALNTGEWVFSGRSGAGVGRSQQWFDAGHGFEVHAAWPGGHAPVTLDISFENADATRGGRAHTRLLAPPLAWLEFARSGTQRLMLRVSPQP